MNASGEKVAMASETRETICADPSPLEFNAVLQLVASYAGSVYGAEQVLGLAPERPDSATDRDLELIEELARALQAEAELEARVEGDVRPLLRRLAPIGSLLDGKELLVLAAHFEGVGGALQQLRRERRGIPLAAEAFSAAPDCAPLAQWIRRSIGPDGEVLDSASPALKRVRAERRRMEKRVRSQLETFAHDPQHQGVVQDTLVTDRNGRWVVPVKAGQRSALQGIVQAASGSGSTLFFEPQGVVGLNNDLAVLRAEESEEQLKVLRALSDQLRAESDLIHNALAAWTELDGLLARARFQLAVEGCRPELSAGGAIELEGARHPLLDQRLAQRRESVGLEAHHGRSVVPLDLDLEPGLRALVITGPNTGGKTVVLKTVGLLALMAQSGLPVPARRARLPRFRALLADIGDRQDLAMNLSTFSAHVHRLLPAFQEQRRPALILIDELGTGTDPAEGSALGVAILEELFALGFHLVVTTHHHAIKRLALRAAGMVNAAMEFDPATLAPTFRLLPGHAGSSHAFEVAEALGLPPKVLEVARRHAAGRERELDQMFEQLDSAGAALRQREQEIARREADLAAMEQQAQLEIRRQAQKSASHAATVRSEIHGLRRQAEQLLKEAKRPSTDRQSRSELRRAFEEVSQKASQLAPVGESWEPGEAGAEGDALKPGDRAMIGGLGLWGRVLEADDPGRPDSDVLLEVEGKRVRFPRARVRRIEPQAEPRSRPPSFAFAVSERRVAPELDLRGLTVEEALERADKYLDDALLGQRRELRLIHGFGTERLKKALRDYLEREPRIDSIRPGVAGEGGDGVTVVTLKHDA